MNLPAREAAELSPWAILGDWGYAYDNHWREFLAENSLQAGDRFLFASWITYRRDQDGECDVEYTFEPLFIDKSLGDGVDLMADEPTATTSLTLKDLRLLELALRRGREEALIYADARFDDQKTEITQHAERLEKHLKSIAARLSR